MRLTQRCTLAVERERLWDFLMDVPRMSCCIPGVAKVEPAEDNRYRGAVKVQVGPIRLTLAGTITIEEQERHAWRASMRADATDQGAGGGVRARMTMTLVPAADGTELVVDTDLAVLGKLGEFGQPIMRKKADGLMQEFAANLQAALAARCGAK